MISIGIKSRTLLKKTFSVPRIMFQSINKLILINFFLDDKKYDLESPELHQNLNYVHMFHAKVCNYVI